MSTPSPPEARRTIARIHAFQEITPPWKLVRVLQSWQVPNNDGGTGWHYEWDVELVQS